ncbi:four-carbon acid sugar kinase family protein [Streptomyces sp. NPDC033538]|uniref:four-carbon acid sugar kinase family protein n=1 Tax=Streptomyces sp. NPDC033538 TaxID=3155367 RepID=UPI0033D67316
MCRRDDIPVVALADDLSGAAEVAALLRLPGRLTLHPADLAVSPAAGESVVVDLDSRYLDDAAAAAAVRSVLRGTRTPAGTPPVAGAGGVTGDRVGDLAVPGTALRPGSGGEDPRAFHAANSASPPGRTLWYKKCDSLLRGAVGAEAVAFAEGAEVLVIATALPAAGRVVRDGVVLVDWVPLHSCAAWRAEERPAPRSVAEALAPLPTEDVPVAAVRLGPRALAARFREVAARGRHPVCDAETDADLTVIATAAALLGPGCRLLGSGGLADALGRRIGSRPPAPDGRVVPAPPETATGRETVSRQETPAAPRAGAVPETAATPESPAAPEAGTAPETPATPESPAAPRAGAVPETPATPESPAAPGAGTAPETPAASQGGAAPLTPATPTAAGVPEAGLHERPLLVVAGSAEPGVVAQVARLVAVGARHIPLSPAELAGPTPVSLPELDFGTVTVVSVDGSGGVRSGAARSIVAGLARAVAALPTRPDLVLTGGETARRVLDSMGVTTLWPVGEIHHGAVHCRTADGRSVVTRPGSFGGPDSFHRIAAALRPRLLPPPAAPPALPSPPEPPSPSACLSPPAPPSPSASPPPAPSVMPSSPSQQGVTQ